MLIILLVICQKLYCNLLSDYTPIDLSTDNIHEVLLQLCWNKQTKNKKPLDLQNNLFPNHQCSSLSWYLNQYFKNYFCGYFELSRTDYHKEARDIKYCKAEVCPVIYGSWVWERNPQESFWQMLIKNKVFEALEIYFPNAFHCQIIIKKFLCTQGAHMSHF